MSRIEIVGGGAGVNDTALIQNALDAVAAGGGGVVYIPDGEYSITSSLLIGDDTHLEMSVGATLIRDFDATGEATATIRNVDFTTDSNPDRINNSGIKISGGVVRTDDSENEGKHLCFVKTQYLTIEGLRFAGVYGDWNTAFRDCQDVVVSNVVMNSGTDNLEDGLHFYGGKRIAITNCDIRCGDDCIAFTQDVGFNPDPQLPIEDVVVSNCYLSSVRANMIRLQVDGAAPVIRRIAISNIVGQCGDGESGSGIVINGPRDTIRISDIEIDEVLLDASDNAFNGLIIDGSERVRVSRMVILQPSLRVAIDAANDVELHDCVVEGPRTASMQCVLVAENAACTNIRIVGGKYSGATQHNIVMGTTNYSVTGFEVSGVELADAADSGLNVNNASHGLVIGNKIHDNGDYGILEGASSDRNNYIGNQLIGNGIDPLFLGGTNFQAIRNIPDPADEIQDSGGFRQTIDGWFVSPLPGTIGSTGVSRFAGRFRAPRPGSVTGIILTTSQSRTGGSLTVTVFKNTGIAGAAGSSTPFSATIDGTTHANRVYKTQGMDVSASKFAAGEEIYLEFVTSGWTAAAATDLFCALEIES